MDLASTNLPLVPWLPEIGRLLGERGLLVLQAEPGAGKSTLAPLALLGEPWLSGRKILMLEPRRLAAVSAATRMAELAGERVGETVGYRVRYDSKVGPHTRLEVLTEALLTRRIQADPGLEGVGLVIFDEFHERSIHADLGLALALEVRELRGDLGILLMSATMDGERVARFLAGEAPMARPAVPGDTVPPEGRSRTAVTPDIEPVSAPVAPPVPVLSCPGRAFPVDTVYRPLAPGRGWEEAFAAGLAASLAEGEGDLLAFLPGVREISRVRDALGRLGVDADVLPLYGTMKLADQERVIRPRTGDRRRVILATSVAETSLTVPRVRIVADSGLSRLARYHPASGMDRLVTEPESAASADQRRGRAGRLGPGTCVRFWAEGDWRPAATDPEIRRSDLAALVLETAVWGAADPSALRWLDPPPESAWRPARALLAALGALDAAGRPTTLGREMVRLGLDPRLAAIALAGEATRQRSLAIACAALLADRDGSGIEGDADFRLRLEALRTGAGTRPDWLSRTRREMERIGRLLSGRRAALRGAAKSAGGVSRPGPAAGDGAGADAAGPQERVGVISWSTADEAAAGRLLLAGFPDRVARLAAPGVFAFPSGRRGRLTGVLRDSEWIVAPEADAGEATGTVYLAAPVTGDDVEAALGRSIVTESAVVWKAGWQPQLVVTRRLGRITVAERRGGKLAAGTVLAGVRERLAAEGIAALPWDDALRRLLSRLRFFTVHAAREAGATPDPGAGPAGETAVPSGDETVGAEPGGAAFDSGRFSDAALLAEADTWLLPYVDTTGGPALDPGRLAAALTGRLSGDERRRFEREVPDQITVPSGSRRRIEYPEGEAPFLAVRIQEVFGLERSPVVGGQPLRLHLLSPASRPLQITDDLASFWVNTWPEVRKEMRGRYPRHYWPENPLEAEPTSRVKPRR